MKVYTAAGLRGVLGALPQGVGETQGLLFAVSHVGGDMMVLALSPRSGAWKAAALLRQ
jgi:hypothetical protein